ncbi:hypothetical protein B0H11DRAFT_1921581 [Mycena galericulata]|nr:hypothetical protein B0H11DRAFT_1921581 [Mycena galericulata]
MEWNSGASGDAGTRRVQQKRQSQRCGRGQKGDRSSFVKARGEGARKRSITAHGQVKPKRKLQSDEAKAKEKSFVPKTHYLKVAGMLWESKRDGIDFRMTHLRGYLMYHSGRAERAQSGEVPLIKSGSTAVRCGEVWARAESGQCGFNGRWPADGGGWRDARHVLGTCRGWGSAVQGCESGGWRAGAQSSPAFRVKQHTCLWRLWSLEGVFMRLHLWKSVFGLWRGVFDRE